MKKHLLWSACLLSILAAYGCNDEIKTSEFKDLCEMSGGTIDPDTWNICHCNEVACSVGIVCMNDGKNCLDVDEKCTTPDITRCISRKKDNLDIGIIQICTEHKNSTSNYLTWQDKDTCGGSCDSKMEACGKDKCYNGAERCSEKSLQVCNGGEWTFFKTCDYGCDKTGCKVCVENEIKCESNNIQYICLNNDWTPIQKCNCQAGDVLCQNTKNGSMMYSCENGNWKQDGEEAAVSCKSDTEAGECKDGVSECQDVEMDGSEAASSRVCHDGQWTEWSKCAGSSCKDTTTCDECATIDTKCNDNIKSFCINGNWAPLQVCDTQCSSNGKDCAVCKHGEQKCIDIVTDDTASGSKTLTCKSDGTWQTAEEVSNTNNYSCKSEVEEGECLNNTKKCANNMIQICQNGTWSSPIYCPFSASCNSTGDDCGECANGAKKCEDGKSFVCQNGAWNEGETCSNGASCASADKCGECANGTTECIDGSSRVCQNGLWTSWNVCSSHTCKDATTCGECAEEATKCENGVQSYCIHNNWAPLKVCDYQCDKAGNACTVCKAGETKCVSRTKEATETEPKVNGSVIIACTDEGSWPEDEDTTNLEIKAVSCKSDTEPGECLNNTTSCSNHMIKTCQHGVWSLPVYCPNNVSCNADDDAEGDACGSCLNGEKKCDNYLNSENVLVSTVFECKKGAWKDAENQCNKGVVCKSAASCGECVEGATSCKDGMISTCKNGVWGDPIACNNNNDCKSATECGECSLNSKFSCADFNTLQTCFNGKWEVGTPCGNSYYCNDGKCEVSTCDNRTSRCVNLDNGKGVLYKCANNKWSINEGTTCENGYSCKDTEPYEPRSGNYLPNHCGTCVNNTVKCQNNDTTQIGELQTCINGAYNYKITCSNNASCSEDNITCGNCRNDTTYCVNLKTRNSSIKVTCKSGNWLTFNQFMDIDNSSTLSEEAKMASLNELITNAVGQIEESEELSCNKNADDFGICKNGTRQAKNGEYTDSICRLEECRNGQWTDVENPNEFSCNGLEIGVCKNGEKQVSEDAETGICTIDVCTDGKWLSQVNEKGVSCKGEEYGECNNTASLVNDFETGSGCTRKYCENGEPKEETSEFSCDTNNNKFGVCKNGEKQFSDDAETGACKIEECQNGVWALILTSDNSCKGDEIGNCNNKMESTFESTETGCTRTFCENGEIKTEVNKYSCNTTNKSFGVCLNGTYRSQNTTNGDSVHNPEAEKCTITKWQVCSDGVWTSPCGAPEWCERNMNNCQCSIDDDNAHYIGIGCE